MSGPSSAVAVIDRDEPMELRAVTAIPTAQRLALALPTMEELQVLKAYGEMFAASGLFPNVKTWQAAAAIIQYGSQLGIDAFTALKDIYWIQGKPTCDASLINSLIKRDHGGDALMPVESTAERCTIKFKRREWDHYEESTVTVADYQHLVNDKTRVPWQTARKDMLWARNVSQIGRRHFSDTIKGLYTREEMRDAEAIEATVRVVERPSAANSPDVTRERGRAVDPTTGEILPAIDADRATEARALGKAIVAAFDCNATKAKQIGTDLIAWRFGVDRSHKPTALELAIVRKAVERWGSHHNADVPNAMYQWMELIGNAATETMAVDVRTSWLETEQDDPFVTEVANLAVDRFATATEQMAAVDAAVDRVPVGVDGP